MRFLRVASTTALILALAGSRASAQSSKEFTYDAGLHILNVPDINGLIQVDGVKYTNLAATTAAVPIGGRASIFDALSESGATSNPINVNPFPNDRAVDVRLGGGVIINTNVPLVLGNGSTVAGAGRIIVTSFGLSSGTLISPGLNFPLPMNQPSVPTLTCHGSGGFLSNGTYRVTLTQVNNINTYAPPSGRVATPGETIGTANEATVTCGFGGSNQAITFNTPSQQIPGGNTTFESKGTNVYMTSGVSGTEIFDSASTTTNITCAASSTFPTACADSTMVTLQRVPTTGNPPPALNRTNPLVVLGDVGPYSGNSVPSGNEFGIRVSNLVVDGTTDAGNSVATGVAGIACVVNFNSQEQGAIQYVNMLNCMGTTAFPGTGFLGPGPTSQNFSMHDFEVIVSATSATNLVGYTPVYLVGVQPGFKSISDFTINNPLLGAPPTGYPTAGVTLNNSSGHVYNGHCEHISTCLTLINNSKVVADYISGGSGPTSPTVTNVVHLDSTTTNADLEGLISGCNYDGTNCNTVLDDTSTTAIHESGAFSPTGWYLLGSPQPNNSSTRDRLSSNSTVTSFYAGPSQHLSSQASDVPLAIGPGQTVTQTADFLDVFQNSALSSKLFSVAANGAVAINGTSGASGTLSISAGTSGALTITTPLVAGTPTWSAGSNSGTPAVTASLPLTISASTGNMVCPSCATTTSGGALSATAPANINASGVISLTSEGTGAKVQLTNSGTTTANDIVTYDTNGNVQDSGTPLANVPPNVSASGIGFAWLPTVVFPPVNPAGSTISTTASQVRVVQFVLPFTLTVGHIVANVTATSSGSFNIGIYNSSGTKVIDTGSIPCSGSGAVSQSVTSTLLPTGVYYYAFGATDITCALTSVANSPNLQNPANLNGSRFATGGSISGGVLPASLTLTKSTTNTYPLAMAEP